MKLSDIFKLDLNTGGGNKLFARIMNKYNVHKKEYENVKQEMNSFSGGGDSDDSAEYYKVNNMEALNQFEDCYLIMTMAHYIDKQGRELIGSCAVAFTGPDPGFNTLYKICYIPSIANINFNIDIKDTFYDVFYKNCRFIGLSVSDEEIKTGFNTIFTPITKEEFYDLNNI